MQPSKFGNAASIAEPQDAERCLAVLTLAFMADPIARWSFADAATYLEAWPAMVRAFAGSAFESGTAYQCGAFAGAALWLAPGSRPNEDALVSTFENAVLPERRDDGFKIFEQMSTFHPKTPHWYLTMIGVDPARQGQGYGSALLASSLARCDQDGLPAYLESTNPANIPLYERHGFEVLGRIQAGTSPILTPMLRRAR